MPSFIINFKLRRIYYITLYKKIKEENINLLFRFPKHKLLLQNTDVYAKIIVIMNL